LPVAYVTVDDTRARYSAPRTPRCWKPASTAGQRTTLDILLQHLVNARTALVTAQHDRVVASYTVLSAVGELNLPKLGINIQLYDPMVHYQ
jgi:hypothetical protein